MVELDRRVVGRSTRAEMSRRLGAGRFPPRDKTGVAVEAQPPEVEPEPEDFSSWTKATLFAHAEELGVDVKKSANKDEIIAALAAADTKDGE